jgi:hypothetical protein
VTWVVGFNARAGFVAAISGASETNNCEGEMSSLSRPSNVRFWPLQNKNAAHNEWVGRASVLLAVNESEWLTTTGMKVTVAAQGTRNRRSVTFGRGRGRNRGSTREWGSGLVDPWPDRGPALYLDEIAATNPT